MLMNYFVVPCSASAFHKVSLCMLSKTFLKVHKVGCEGVWCSRHSSIMILKVVIWYVQLTPGQHPACTSLRSISILSLILQSSILLTVG